MLQINQALASTQISLLWICAIVAAMVFVALVYSIVAYRPVDAAVINSAHTKRREAVWALIPIFIVIAAALPAIRNVVPSESNDGLVTDTRGEPCSPLPDTAGSNVTGTSASALCAKHR